MGLGRIVVTMAYIWIVNAFVRRIKWVKNNYSVMRVLGFLRVESVLIIIWYWGYLNCFLLRRLCMIILLLLELVDVI